MAIPDENDNEIMVTILMDKKELKEYIDRLNDYYEVSYYEKARLDNSKKGYQPKYFTINLENEKGEKFFKLVEIIGNDKKFPMQKMNRIIGEIRIKEREKVS